MRRSGIFLMVLGVAMILFGLLYGGCAQVQASDDSIALSGSVTFPGGVYFTLNGAPPESEEQLDMDASAVPTQYLNDVELEGGMIQGSQSLGFLQELKVTMNPPSGSSLPTLTLLDSTQNNADTIFIPPQHVNLKDFLAKSPLTFTVDATGNPPPSNDYTMTFTVYLSVSGEVKQNLIP